jgi:hypothetical protein
LCSRDRLEAIVRRKPQTVADLADVKDLRRWQVAVLGGEFIGAMKR